MNVELPREDWVVNRTEYKVKKKKWIDEMLGIAKYAALYDEEFGIAKIAASYDARRKKQYWQMLKKMHGGADAAIDNVRMSGDDGIWHATNQSKLYNIGEEGISADFYAGPVRRDIKSNLPPESAIIRGVPFGDKITATKGAQDKLYSKTNHTNIDDDKWLSGTTHYPVFPTDMKKITFPHGKNINSPKDLREFEAVNTSDEYRIDKGALLRLAKPSELAGTKQLYPKKIYSNQEMNDENSVQMLIKEDVVKPELLYKTKERPLPHTWNKSESFENISRSEDWLKPKQVPSKKEAFSIEKYYEEKPERDRQKEILKQQQQQRAREREAFLARIRRFEEERSANILRDQAEKQRVREMEEMKEKKRKNIALSVGGGSGIGLAGLGAYKWKNRSKGEDKDEQ